MAADLQYLGALEEKLTAVFLDFCSKHGQAPLSVAAQYHGSLIWQLLWANDLSRSLRLSATAKDNDGTDVAIEIDVSVGDQQSYRTEQIADWIMRSGASEHRSLHHIRNYLDTAYERANAIEASELDQTYLLPGGV